MGQGLTLSAVAGTIVYGALTVVWTSTGQSILNKEEKIASDRNMASFNTLADARKTLNDPSRSTPWGKHQAQISRAIFSNHKTGWEFTPLLGYRYDLSPIMAKANIAIVPHKEAGEPTTLIVDKSHGCLMVGVDKDKDQAADEARVLLDAFKNNGSKGYLHLGTYTYADKGSVKYAGNEGVAAEHCPKP